MLAWHALRLRATPQPFAWLPWKSFLDPTESSARFPHAFPPGSPTERFERTVEAEATLEGREWSVSLRRLVSRHQVQKAYPMALWPDTAASTAAQPRPSSTHRLFLPVQMPGTTALGHPVVCRIWRHPLLTYRRATPGHTPRHTTGQLLSHFDTERTTLVGSAGSCFRTYVPHCGPDALVQSLRPVLRGFRAGTAGGPQSFSCNWGTGL